MHYVPPLFEPRDILKILLIAVSRSVPLVSEPSFFRSDLWPAVYPWAIKPSGKNLILSVQYGPRTQYVSEEGSRDLEKDNLLPHSPFLTTISCFLALHAFTRIRHSFVYDFPLLAHTRSSLDGHPLGHWHFAVLSTTTQSWYGLHWWKEHASR